MPSSSASRRIVSEPMPCASASATALASARCRVSGGRGAAFALVFSGTPVLLCGGRVDNLTAYGYCADQALRRKAPNLEAHDMPAATTTPAGSPTASRASGEQMRAILQSGYGTVDVLSAGTIARPELGP